MAWNLRQKSFIDGFMSNTPYFQWYKNAVTKAIKSKYAYSMYEDKEETLLFSVTSYRDEFKQAIKNGIFDSKEFIKVQTAHENDPHNRTMWLIFVGEENLNYVKLCLGNIIDWNTPIPDEFITDPNDEEPDFTIYNLNHLFKDLRKLEKSNVD